MNADARRCSAPLIGVDWRPLAVPYPRRYEVCSLSLACALQTRRTKIVGKILASLRRIFVRSPGSQRLAVRSFGCGYGARVYLCSSVPLTCKSLSGGQGYFHREDATSAKKSDFKNFAFFASSRWIFGVATGLHCVHLWFQPADRYLISSGKSNSITVSLATS